MILVRPSLLLSPNGSFDRNGAVSPTAYALTTAGQYGQAWYATGAGHYVELSGHAPPVQQGTIIVRYWSANPGNASLQNYVRVGTTGDRIQIRSQNGTNQIFAATNLGGNWNETWRAALQVGHDAAGMVWTPSLIRLVASGYLHIGHNTNAPPAAWGNSGVIRIGPSANPVESVLVYPSAIPDREIARIAAIPAAWTMNNAAARVTSRLRDQTVGLGVRVA